MGSLAEPTGPATTHFCSPKGLPLPSTPNAWQAFRTDDRYRPEHHRTIGSNRVTRSGVSPSWTIGSRHVASERGSPHGRRDCVATSYCWASR
jgi:hypothetical protein